MELAVVPVIAIFIATVCSAVKIIPNAAYLGMGYNIIKGNPDNNYKDPGLLFSTLNFKWKNVTVLGRPYMVPDKVQVLQTKSCGYEAKVSTILGSKSYQDTLSDDVGVDSEGGLLWGARFSGSAEYKNIARGTKRYHRVYTNARAKCAEYELALKLHLKIPLSDAFVYAFGNLSTNENETKAYENFIDNFGTHITSRVTFGAKMVVRSEFEQQAWSNMKESGLNIALATQLSFGLLATSNKSTETMSDRMLRQTFESQRSSYIASYRGSNPPSDGRWETWAQSTGDSPAPIAYKLVPLTYIIDHTHFPKISTGILGTKKRLLISAYSTYCLGIPGCGIPGADPVAFNLVNSIANYRRSPSRSSCPPNYKLLSCGIKNIRKNRGSSCDSKRYAIPVSNSECECSDRNGARCVSRCSVGDMSFTIATSSEFHGIANVSCPSDYKVRITMIKYLKKILSVGRATKSRTQNSINDFV